MNLTEQTAVNWAKKQLGSLYGNSFTWLGKGRANYATEFDATFGKEWRDVMGPLIPDACFILKKGNSACMGIVEAEWSAPMSRDKLRRYYDLYELMADLKNRQLVVYTIGQGFNLELRDPAAFFAATIDAHRLIRAL